MWYCTRHGCHVAIQHDATIEASLDRESLFILSDCKTAIDLVINRYKVDRHAHVLGRVRSHLRTLCDLNVEVTLIWIPGHSDIYHNELADRSAKNTLQYAYDISTSLELTFSTCRRLISNQCNTAWQLRWDRANVARPTHDLLPYVGRKLLLPDDRCCAISYVQLLLEDSMLKAHQHGLHITCECECGQGIEDTYHFLHECTSCRYMSGTR